MCLGPFLDNAAQCGVSIGKSSTDGFAEIYSSSPSHRRECTYYIAVGYYKLKNYQYARKFNGMYYFPVG